MTPFPLPPGSTIGILGGGQLGRMLAMAAARLGFDVAILSPEAGGPAARVATHAIVGDYQDPAALKALADLADVITFEFENVPAPAVAELQRLGARVAPSARALELAQDRVVEKTFLNGAGIATVAFAPVDDAVGLRAALQKLGAPVLLKTRQGGYDGKGQLWVNRAADADSAMATLGGRPSIAEAPADFRREVAMIAARGRDGEIALYPLTESHHENGILRRTSAPATATPKLLAEAERITATLLVALDYVGVLGVELFERDDGRLLVNEFAPRVHNTGHWTLDGCEVDQFEQHIRAVAGWPLGPTAAIHHVEMTNLLGEEANGWERLARQSESRVWLYGKQHALAGRKMGHVNRLSRLDPPKS
jgi:5-(carboxyamino)imidazole ribonucleotide synthase